jgi:nucleotide-binding universal stress UspA family protein
MIRILCPTDFSDVADTAIAYAAAVSNKIGAELTLLNVQSIFSLPPKEIIKGKHLATEPIVEKLEAQCYQVMSLFKINCVAEVQPWNGLLIDILAKRASDFDLLIMGTNGADDNYEYFFGSRSYQVARETSIPVLLVPVGCTYKPITTLLYAFNYEQTQLLPLVQLSKWCALLEVNVTVVQVKKHYSREDELFSKEVEQRVINSHDLPNAVFDTIYHDDALDGLNSYLVKNQYDALAICSIQHNFIHNIFHKSLVQTLSSVASCPLFIFHE